MCPHCYSDPCPDEETGPCRLDPAHPDNQRGDD